MHGEDKRYEVQHVEFLNDHIVDALCFDAAVGACQSYLAHLLKHMDILLVKHVFVQQKRHHTVAQPVPHGGGNGFRHKTPQHKRTRLQTGEPLGKAFVRDQAEEMHLAVGGEQVEHARLVERERDLA